MKKISSLYIHFPFCEHLCNYCDFYKHKLEGRDQVISFEQLLLKQWSAQKELLKREGTEIGKLETLYIGGGTPSLWKLDGPRFLKEFFQKENILFDQDYEFTIEVDPGTWTALEIEKWIEVGVNRFSVGSQAFSERFLSVMDRKHSLEEVRDTIHFMSSIGANYSVDLMIGLPESESRDLEKELNELMAYNPNHLSVYILKARKNYPHFKNLPSDELIADEYLFVSDYLRDRGYEHYEVSNFARDDSFSRHNLKYWEYDSVLGLGPNATGLIVHDNASLRYQWKSQVIGFTEERLTGSSLLIEKLYMHLRNFRGLNLGSLFSKKEIQEIEKLYRNWGDLDYLDDSSSLETIVLNPKGYLMCDSIINDIFVNSDI